MCLDLVNAYLFGLSNGSKFLTGGTDIRVFLEHHENAYGAEMFWPQELPRLMRILEKIGVHLYPRHALSSMEWMESWTMAMCREAEVAMRRAEESTLEDLADFPTVYASIKHAKDQDFSHVAAQAKEVEIASESSCQGGPR